MDEDEFFDAVGDAVEERGKAGTKESRELPNATPRSAPGVGGDKHAVFHTAVDTQALLQASVDPHASVRSALPVQPESRDPKASQSQAPPQPPRPAARAPPLPPRKPINAHGSTLSEPESQAESEPQSNDNVSEEEKYLVVNKDTGEKFDVRELEQHLPSTGYSLLPTKATLLKKERRRSLGGAPEGGDSSDDGSAGPKVVGKAVKQAMGKKMTQFKKKMQKLTKESKVPRQDPRCVRVTVHKKDFSDFGSLMLMEELQVQDGPIWAIAFSHSGKWLAVGGQDATLRVYRVYGLEGSGSENQPAESAEGGQSMKSGEQRRASGAGENWAESMASPFFAGRKQLLEEKPYLTFTGHTSDIIDLSWSRNDFLLSASLDKTVRLWHPTQGTCLDVFQHGDIVTSVDFHPRFEKFFVSGSFDKKIRIWNIRDGRVHEWQQTQEMVTAASFSSSGEVVVVGLFRAQVLFYQMDGMRYFTQIECRNRRGTNKSGCKVTGFAFKPNTKDEILVTTNDSRLRLYQTDDFSMRAKFKGLTNDSLQIRASFSEDGKHIICGSENGKVYIWDTEEHKQGSEAGAGPASGRHHREHHTNKSYESFSATSSSRQELEVEGECQIVTCAQFVPTRAVRACLGEERAEPTAMIVCTDYEGIIRIYYKATQELVQTQRQASASSAHADSSIPPSPLGRQLGRTL